MTLGILPGFLTAALAPQIAVDVEMSLVDLGTLMGLFFGTAALVSTPAGRLTERLGWARTLRLAATLAAISLGGIGWLGTSVWIFGVFFVIGGIAASIGQTATNLTIARCVTRDRHGLLFGFRHAAIPAATLLAGMAVPAVALTVGWRIAFVGAAALAVATFVAVPRGTHRHVPAATVRREPATLGRPSTPMSLLVLLAVAAGLAVGAIDALAAFFVSYAVDIGVTEAGAGVLLAVGSLCGIATRVVAGWMIDRRQRSDLAATAGMILVGALGLGILNLGSPAALAAGGLVAFVAGWGWSGLFTFAVVRDNLDAPAAATGVTQTGKFLGAGAGPLAFGVVAESASFAAAWWLTVAALVAAAGMILAVGSRRPDPALPHDRRP